MKNIKNADRLDIGVNLRMPKKRQALTGTLVGRPTIYKPEYCQMLIDHCSTGLSFESFAGVISVGRTTIYEWRDEHEDFRKAFEEGYQKALLFFEKVGVQIMMDRLTDKNGNKAKGNIVAWYMMMKNRFGYRDNPEEKQTNLVKFQNIPELLNELQKEENDT